VARTVNDCCCGSGGALNYMRIGDKAVVTNLDRIARSTKHLLQIVGQLQEDYAF
jgi:DNA invertase Pin-like site-specific DNA recombinase